MKIGDGEACPPKLEKWHGDKPNMGATNGYYEGSAVLAPFVERRSPDTPLDYVPLQVEILNEKSTLKGKFRKIIERRKGTQR